MLSIPGDNVAVGASPPMLLPPAALSSAARDPAHQQQQQKEEGEEESAAGLTVSTIGSGGGAVAVGKGARYVMPGADVRIEMPPSLAAVYREYRAWCKLIRAGSAGQLNQRILEGGAKQLVATCEALQSHKIVEVAMEIEKRIKSGLKLVLIAGPSASGKTTFASKLGIQLRTVGCTPVVLSVDNYYLPRLENPKDENGNYKFEGRFNQGVVSINLPQIGLEVRGDMDKFWPEFDRRLDVCYEALMCRHNALKGVKSDVSPIHWQYGALARLKKDEPIDKLLYGGYSTISLGYAGLYECVKYMTGHSHTEAEGTPFALEVMQHMNDKCTEWKKAENMDYSLYGTPLESTTYKFAKCLQKRFGIVPGITDKNYITNSYHVHVSEPIDAFTKLKFESEFQKLSPGGAISYVEVPNMQDNLEAVISVLQFIYDNIMYAELNTKSDYCQCCGYDGEIKIVEDDGKLVWECPKCGNRDQNKLNVARRTCGYIGTQFWNQGRTQEIKDRVLHL